MIGELNISTTRPVESLTDLESIRDKVRFNFSLQQISCADASAFWSIQDGALQHKSGGFFCVAGFFDPRNGSERLMLFQPQGAINGLATSFVLNERCFLLQARAEPGNTNEVQYGPSLQSTPANWMRLHGGKPSPYAPKFLEFSPSTRYILHTEQLDLGGRYLLKTKRVSIVEMPFDNALDGGFHWVARTALAEGLCKDFFFNTDLRAAIALAPWSSDPNCGELTPRSDIVRKSLDAPIRSETIGALVSRLTIRCRPSLIQVPLQELKNWVVGAEGFDEVIPHQRLSVRFFRVAAQAREMSSWIQPLLVGQTTGRSVLACRHHRGYLECRVSLIAEIGLPNGVAFGPTFLAYPGESIQLPEWFEALEPQSWISLEESDEGGRFLNHTSRCELVFLAENAEVPEDLPGAWIRVSELKHLLGLSNLCTIQLRTITSLLLVAE